MLIKRIAMAVMVLLSITVFATENDIFNQSIATLKLNNKTKSLSVADYQDAVYDTIRNRFYHGKPPEGEEAELKQEVWDKLVIDTLVVMTSDEADMNDEITAKVKDKLQKYVAKYASNPNWDSVKEQVLPVVRDRFLRETFIDSHKQAFENTIATDTEEVKSFYLKNPKLFTEPERNRVSIILINVDPSSSSEVWNVAIEQIKMIREDINSPEDFKEKAIEFSTDVTAEMGGDMGILHDGQLGGRAKEVVTELDVGQVSEPVILLEGVALFMVTERIGATHHTFEEVADRAKQLTLREKKVTEWDKYLASLRDKAEIVNHIDIQTLIN